MLNLLWISDSFGILKPKEFDYNIDLFKRKIKVEYLELEEIKPDTY